MTAQELKEAGALIREVFAYGSEGGRGAALMKALVEADALGLAMQFWEIQALEGLSERLGKMITVMEESELWKMRSQK